MAYKDKSDFFAHRFPTHYVIRRKVHKSHYFILQGGFREMVYDYESRNRSSSVPTKNLGIKDE